MKNCKIVCLAKWIQFTAQIEQAIVSKKNLNAVIGELKESLSQLTSFDFLAVEEKHRKIVEFKVKAMILDHIHFIEVVEELIKANINSVSDWSWQKQLRFYIRNDEVVIAKMCHSEFEYSYEYQGNFTKLVHTNLTDKCYMTLMIAMLHGYGGNPFGPAATGKTESVKSLGALLGRQVIVFNCDEGLDVHSMGRIFVGIVKSASWACFDEFNRASCNDAEFLHSLTFI